MNKSQNGFLDNIESETVDNANYRKVLYTGKNMQLVVMSLNPGEDIGLEVHNENDQFFRIEQGTAEAFIDGEVMTVNEDEVIIVKAGSEHNITNVGDNELKLYTIYAPAHHPEGTIHATKADDPEEDHDH